MCLQSVKNGVLLKVRVQPNGQQNAVRGIFRDRLKVEVTATPENDQANQAVIKLLAKTFALKPTNIHLQSGKTSREKIFLCVDGDRENLMALILKSSYND